MRVANHTDPQLPGLSWLGAHTFDLAIELLEEGLLTDQGMITHRFPFEQHKHAVSVAADKSSGAIKVVLTYC